MIFARDVDSLEFRSFLLNDSIGQLKFLATFSLPGTGWQMAHTDRFYFLPRMNAANQVAGIDTYAVDSASGTLARVQGFDLPAGTQFSAPAASADGQCLFAYGEVFDQFENAQGFIYTFLIATDGALSIAGKPFAAGSYGSGTYRAAVINLQTARRGNLLFATHEMIAPHATMARSADSLTIHADGSFSAGPVIAESSCYACDVGDPMVRNFAVTADGRFALVEGIFTWNGFSQVEVFSLAPDGTPTLRSTNSDPASIGVVVDSHFMYVSNAALEIHGYYLHPDGTLSPIDDGKPLGHGVPVQASATETHLLVNNAAVLEAYAVNADGTLMRTGAAALSSASLVDAPIALH